MQLTIDDFLKLRAQLPIVDVRSEGEYAEGHIQSAVNIPILNNAERVEVGTDYKRKGQAEAIKTGFRLVGPRLLNIINDAESIGNELLVHCWRGGMRSSNFCQFVGMAKIKTHQLAGGYKSYRTKALESFKQPLNLIVIGGCTGSGKSEILGSLKANGEQVIDLEKLASHKGSVFGGLQMSPQPTTEQFQNDLFEDILKLDYSRTVWIEDESIAVGRIFLPEGLWTQMNNSPIVEINVDKVVRIQRLVEEYGPADRTLFLEAMMRITKKLGGQHFNAARDKLLQNDMASVIDILLNYYDKAYINGLSKKQHRVKASVQWSGHDIHSFTARLIQEAKAFRS
ncbi:MAG TPA: tRNA 2-selenouridine(34) synthase MnmH [Ohtaekwangia sp.]|uniref:tRNA 2-selenouridine(34) synthase MnmH n=1 Tax=Ohtaekwangia sp. TaxID=2066019 RepID=UPI002F95CFDD